MPAMVCANSDCDRYGIEVTVRARRCSICGAELVQPPQTEKAVRTPPEQRG